MIRRFQFVRHIDETGMSGTGIVAVGAVFPNGKVVMQWAGEIQSTVLFDSLEELEYIHSHGHKQGCGKVIFLD